MRGERCHQAACYLRNDLATVQIGFRGVWLMPLTILRKLLGREGSPQPSSAPPDRRRGPPDWVLPGAAIDMWFAKDLYFGASPDNLRVERGSPGFADDRAGRWVKFGDGVARVTAKGLLI